MVLRRLVPLVLGSDSGADCNLHSAQQVLQEGQSTWLNHSLVYPTLPSSQEGSPFQFTKMYGRSMIGRGGKSQRLQVRGCQFSEHRWELCGTVQMMQ